MQTLLKFFLMAKGIITKIPIQIQWINTSAHANKIVPLSHCKRSKIQKSIWKWMLMNTKMLDFWVWNNLLNVRKKERKQCSRFGVIEDMAVSLQAKCPTPTYLKCMFNGFQWWMRTLDLTNRCKTCQEIILWVNRRIYKAFVTGIGCITTIRNRTSMSCAKSFSKYIRNDLHFIIVEMTYMRVDTRVLIEKGVFTPLLQKFLGG